MIFLKIHNRANYLIMTTFLLVCCFSTIISAQSNNLVVEKTKISDSENYSANSITIGPDVTIEGTGNVILHSNTIAVKPQFFILSGGQLNIINGSVPVGVEEEEENAILPKDFVVRQNYPNPFNPQTTIFYNLARSSYVRITVYDLNGREVATLVNKYQIAGKYNIIFDAKDLSSGIYFYRVSAGSEQKIMKMALLK